MKARKMEKENTEAAIPSYTHASSELDASKMHMYTYAYTLTAPLTGLVGLNHW